MRPHALCYRKHVLSLCHTNRGISVEKIKLVDAIANLRTELYQAIMASKNEPLKLQIDAVDVEFAIEIAKRGDAGGEISFDVYVADGKFKAGGELGSTHSHRIKLSLKPLLNGQSPVAVSGRGSRADD